MACHSRTMRCVRYVTGPAVQRPQEVLQQTEADSSHESALHQTVSAPDRGRRPHQVRAVTSHGGTGCLTGAARAGQSGARCEPGGRPAESWAVTSGSWAVTRHGAQDVGKSVEQPAGTGKSTHTHADTLVTRPCPSQSHSDIELTANTGRQTTVSYATTVKS